jgi:hypothetical protein
MFKSILALLVLLIGVGGGGYYNYTRNAPMDADLLLPRPYATLSTRDVGKLLVAYEADLAKIKGSVAEAPGGEGVIERFGASDVAGKAQGFASFQHENQRWKNARGKVFELEKTVADVRLEKSIRDRGLDIEQTRIWRRISTF